MLSSLAQSVALSTGLAYRSPTNALIRSAQLSTTSLHNTKPPPTSTSTTIYEEVTPDLTIDPTDPLSQFRIYEQLRGPLNMPKLKRFFLRRPTTIALRIATILRICQETKNEWDDCAPIGGDTKESDDAFMIDDLPPSERGKVLCARVSSMGPVAIKAAQTLSQRPDIVGHEACTALKTLQTRNLPFENGLAHAILRESLGWEGPIAPNLVDNEGEDVEVAECLFAWMSVDPIAVASLGQVYQAKLHDGRLVAVKIQRPDGTQLLCTDTISFKLVWAILDKLRTYTTNNELPKGLVMEIVDRVARDMTNELDYVLEARNAKLFEESLEFLGFVKTPDIVEEFLTDRILVTEWVNGDHLENLGTKEEKLAMTRMAVEACTASLVLTGFVHADPHEGNLMLDTDGNMVFLDFGLMSNVDESVMEAFACGIRSCLAEDWVGVTTAFQDAGFIDDPIVWRPDTDTQWQNFEKVDVDTGENLGLETLAEDLGRAMLSVDGGTSKFGALATVLNTELSGNWKMKTPAYVILLVRTFLTLEGIAARVDPTFNIYEIAMPWAVRRSLSPSTQKGIQTLRGALLTEDNRIQWGRFMELAEEALRVPAPTDGTEKLKDDGKGTQTDAARAAAMSDAINALMGSPGGAVLRRAIVDLDSVDLVQRLLSKESRTLRHKAVLAMTDSVKEQRLKRKAEKKLKKQALQTGTELAKTQNVEGEVRNMSETALRIKRKQKRTAQKVTLFLIMKHVRRQFANPITFVRASYLTLRLLLGLTRQSLMRKIRSKLRRRQTQSLGAVNGDAVHGNFTKP
eukprot:CAMPEP_0194420790 /NCGR_PEP_ID=MMETSP0176-20130528/20076_1 /TAXON_ID=216777 /ORGANISM="Proboscia alata, Strain PI-D3" /LENGTH=798 /DNA_ID=CAMNT_0039228595 /DNA_START=397 /DNA_END=2793 /DNA_ORIENTATION=+